MTRLHVATSEDEQGGEAERLRQRLRAAGVLADSNYRPRLRPNDADVEAAARRAGQGTPLSDLVAHMRTAFWRKNRIGELDLGACRAPLDLAAELIGRHRLRTYDGVQLASAITIRSLDPECRIFAASDIDLLGAAASAGFAPLPSPSGR